MEHTLANSLGFSAIGLNVEQKQSLMSRRKRPQDLKGVVAAAIVSKEESDILMLLHIFKKSILPQPLRLVITGNYNNGFHSSKRFL